MTFVNAILINNVHREKIAQCYDFTLDKVGMDIQSYSIWNDYIHFLRNVEAVGSYAENQRITAVRKVYQRGVITPMLNIEQLWKDYIAYELAINPMIAEKMQQVILEIKFLVYCSGIPSK